MDKFYGIVVGNNPVNWIDPYGLEPYGWGTALSKSWTAIKTGLDLNQAYYDYQRYKMLLELEKNDRQLMKRIDCEKGQEKFGSDRWRELLDLEEKVQNRYFKYDLLEMERLETTFWIKLLYQVPPVPMR